MQALLAIADPTRRRIVELLAVRERTAGELVDEFDMSAPAISQHLKVLREVGLVAAARRPRAGAARGGRGEQTEAEDLIMKANDQPGKFTSPTELRIVRTLPGPIERVW